MSDSTNIKHTNLISFLEDHNSELNNIIQHLCLSRLLVPKDPKKGITLFMPDQELMRRLKKITNDSPQEAVKIIQSMISHTYLSTPLAFKEQLNDVVTSNNQKLEVEYADGRSVQLKNGATLTTSKKFTPFSARNIAVYDLKYAFPCVKPLDRAGVQEFNTANSERVPKVVRGGYDLLNDPSGGYVTRQKLFEIAAKAYDPVTGRDPFLEILVSWLDFTREEYPQLYALIKQYCTLNTIASAAVILQPFKIGKLYIEEPLYLEWCTRCTDPETELFCANPKPSRTYSRYVNNEEFAELSAKVLDVQKSLTNDFSRPNAVHIIEQAYQEIMLSKDVHPLRKELYNRDKTMPIKEAELFNITSLFILDNDRYEPAELMRILSRIATLNNVIFVKNGLVETLEKVQFWCYVYGLFFSNLLFPVAGMRFSEKNYKLDISNLQNANGSQYINGFAGIKLSEDTYIKNKYEKIGRILAGYQTEDE